MSKKHTLTGQPRAALGPHEQPGFDERAQFGSIPLPQVHPVPGAHLRLLQVVGEPEAREERVTEALVVTQLPAVDDDRLPRRDAGDVIVGTRNILPPGAGRCRVCPTSEPEPFTVGPVLQIMTRLASRPRDV